MGKPESKSPISSMFSRAFRRPNATPSSTAAPSDSLAPPPSYTEATSHSASTGEDPHAFLSAFDTIFLIDDSASMRGSRWEETRKVLEAIVPICTAHDEDGVDIYFLNHKTDQPEDRAKGSAGTGYRGVRDPKHVQSIFDQVQPRNGTLTARRLWYILRPYTNLYKKKVDETGDETCLKPLNIIVITDGAPNDEPDQVIVKVAKILDDKDAPLYQVGIQFFQVGNDPEATKALRDMDDQLSSGNNAGMRDIVDTTTFDARPDLTKTGTSFLRGRHTSTQLTSETVLKVVLGAVVRRLDRVETRRS
ncbi:uncharacterized protein B0I36DRAFT_30554 [Microdochium trichocladiopsis]|uniref:VWFA domain-containing protein n=1 Tax=Microdochium trichocladiopsis TaxID=1682393 RepID=A0A9P8XWJ3_9PEZI|nr:uncharacterized protein B0I36DRAFT_30554 [Microdochium trichocladiopsis]KAH7021247.1 hypothetical protein B0I36DRAFT_30554 [Microdochium trichocladiopsis]